MPKPVGIIVAEPIAPIVSVPAILSLARHGFDQALIGLDAEVVAAQVHRALLLLGRSGASLLKQGSPWLSAILLWDWSRYPAVPEQCVDCADLATAVAICAVEPVIQAVLEPVRAMLLIAFNETCEERLANVRFAVAIGVLGVKDFR